MDKKVQLDDINEEDFPYNKDGVSPDAIMNPHAIPAYDYWSILECILEKSCNDGRSC